MWLHTLAGSVIIILRPGFFFGFESVSSEPESIAFELFDSTESVQWNVKTTTSSFAITFVHYRIVFVEAMFLCLVREGRWRRIQKVALRTLRSLIRIHIS
jgi:hypothetical protein